MPGLDGLPHITVSFLRHIGMANQIVRLANQFIDTVTADIDEAWITVGDFTAQVSGRNQSFIIRVLVFPLSHWQVESHKGDPRSKTPDTILIMQPVLNLGNKTKATLNKSTRLLFERYRRY
jgi:hypothetical protein